MHDLRKGNFKSTDFFGMGIIISVVDPESQKVMDDQILRSLKFTFKLSDGTESQARLCSSVSDFGGSLKLKQLYENKTAYCSDNRLSLNDKSLNYLVQISLCDSNFCANQDELRTFLSRYVVEISMTNPQIDSTLVNLSDDAPVRILERKIGQFKLEKGKLRSALVEIRFNEVTFYN